MVADLTKPDNWIVAETLAAYQGSPPFYLVFPGDGGRSIKLPTILLPGHVLKGLEEARKAGGEG